MTDTAGAYIAANSYDEYGIPGSANQGRFQYTGQAWLQELGMYSYKARIYSPTLGRFLQTDPAGYPDGPNWYAYATNDPINRRDPSGLDTSCSAEAGCIDLGNGDIVVSAGGGGFDSFGGIDNIFSYIDNARARARALQDALDRRYNTLAAQIAGGRQQKGNCGAGPKVGISGTYGFTLFAGDRGLSVGIEVGATTVGEGSQFFLSGGVSGYRGIGAYAAGGGGGSLFYRDGPMKSGFEPSTERVHAGGVAWGPGAEVSYSRKDGSTSISPGLRGGYGAYLGTGEKHSFTLATPQIGCE